MRAVLPFTACSHRSISPSAYDFWLAESTGTDGCYTDLADVTLDVAGATRQASIAVLLYASDSALVCVFRVKMRPCAAVTHRACRGREGC